MPARFVVAMKCDHCESAMSLGSTVCNSSCCSFTYHCDICGRQRLTSEPISPGRRPGTQWPDRSGYKPGYTSGENSSADEHARQILDSNEKRAATLAHSSDDSLVLLDTSVIDPLLEETGEDLARDFSYQAGSHQLASSE